MINRCVERERWRERQKEREKERERERERERKRERKRRKRKRVREIYMHVAILKKANDLIQKSEMLNENFDIIKFKMSDR